MGRDQQLRALTIEPPQIQTCCYTSDGIKLSPNQKIMIQQGCLN